MSKLPAYKDSAYSTEERIEDLLSRMTLEEKINQLLAELPDFLWQERKDGELVISDGLKSILKDPPCGKVGLLTRNDVFANRGKDLVAKPAEAAKISNEMQRYLLENTRLGIPMLSGNDSNHCHLGYGATMFPSVLSMGCTWNKDLQYRTARAIAVECRSRGEHIAYAPDLDVVRDPRFGRSDQNYGEDPYHAAEMGVAMVKGLQGKSLDNQQSIVAMLRAYPGAGEMDGGHDFAELNLGMIDMQEVVLYPFARAVKAGAEGIMVERSVYNGIPVMASRYYLVELPRNEWGFKGITMADAWGVQILAQSPIRIAHDNVEAGAKALKAGLDQSCPDALLKERLTGSRDARAYGRLDEALERGMIEVADIDYCVRHVLRLKFVLGLFENPYADPEYAEEVNRCQTHLDLALETARESLILLENKENLLPLSKDIPSIAVIGASAHDHVTQLGDCAPLHEQEDVTTILQGIRNILPQTARINYAKGCGIRDMSTEGFGEAIEAAKKSDVVVTVVGSSSVGIQYEKDGLLNGKRSPEADCGENVTRVSLDFSGVQLDLLKELKALGKPLVVVLIHGRPISAPWLKENADALIDASYPGEAGGTAVAEVIFGDYNPGGRLTVSVPMTVGQLPTCYYYRIRYPYLEMDHHPLYPFGYGLSYGKFEYGNVNIEKDRIREDESTVLSVDVTNTGDVKGDEVVQLYIRDEVASVTRFNKQLKGFERITLNAGENKTVRFDIGFDQLCFFGPDDTWIVEPGEFTLMVGGDSSTPAVTAKLQVQS